jgi:hypothetical protein
MRSETTIGGRLLSAGCGLSLLFGAQAVARADNFKIVNNSPHSISVALATAESGCASGTRDIAWTNIGPNSNKEMDVNTSGRFLIGAISNRPDPADPSSQPQ